jgi:hypothetical protein
MGFSAAERLGAAWLPVDLHVFSAPTATYPSAVTAVFGFGLRCLNRFTYNVIMRVAWSTRRAAVNAWREGALGLAPISCARGVLGIVERQRIPSIVACSTLFCGPQHTRPDDMASNYVVGGFAFMPDNDAPPGAASAAADGQAAEFLMHAAADGVPVVYLGLGSMPAKPAALAALAAEVCASASVRAIVVAGWSGVDASAAASNPALLILKDVSHTRLFPQVACVIHHCGIGTTAAGLRAGVPQVPVPFFGDQPANAAVLVQLGVAPVSVPWVGAPAAAVAAAVVAAVRRAIDPAQPFAAAARRLGELVRAESAGALDRYADMVEGACKWTEQLP